VVSDQLDYDLVEDMKRTRENISFYELTKLKQQRKNLLKALDNNNVEKQTTATASKDKGKTSLNSASDKNKQVNANDVLIGDKSNSHTPPFLLTFEIFNKNVHNCLVDSGASSNIMPYSVCKKINAEPQKFFHTNCTTRQNKS
jgi:hypothetical protein